MDELTHEKELRSLLAQKFEEQHIEAPEQAWNAIQTELFQSNSKKIGLWTWYFLGTIVIACLLLPLIFSNHESNYSIALTSKSTLRFGKNLTLSKNKSSDYETIKSNNNNTKSINNYKHSQLKKADLIASKKGTEQTTNYPLTLISQPRNLSYSGSQSIDSVLLVSRLQFHPINTFESSLLFPTILPFDASQFNNGTSNVSNQHSGWYLEVFSGLGRNVRTYEGYIEKAKQNKHAVFVSRSVKFKNTNMGVYVRKELTPSIQLRTGLNYGINTFTTRFFPIRIANAELNKEIQVSSPTGDLKSGNLELESAANQTSDSTSFLMRISHRSTYYQIPLSLTINSTNVKGPVVYGFTGLDFIFRGKEENKLLIRRQDFAKTAEIQRATKGKNAHLGLNVGFGISSTTSKKVQVYSECVYSRIFGPYYTGNVLTIYSQNWQLNAGLRFKL